MKTYNWQTEEGLKITVELLQKGLVDESQVEDWKIRVDASPGYVVDDYDQEESWQEPGFVLRTSREEE